MAELKTKKTEQSVTDFIAKIEGVQKRKDALEIIALMESVTKTKGKMWGPAIIGFGDKVISYKDGRTIDWFVMGFSPRKQNFALYVSGAVQNKSGLLEKLGKHKTSKGCLYVTKLDEIDRSILKDILKNGWKD